ncbi:6-phosphogluconate phosphatase [Roseobacter fucihabitans]|uniref:phosphoglycolate phosphatase n=1 Tax=Roseobacter fucihabitans TaxID=1537242 RepID=A0ABZ2BLK6_9RHOB|nr:HAD family phosphatase [Roseobacter litoralis]MBC6966451.1 6-phosphogluconate phosphatase [Roseobacter litoralis]
MIFPPDLVIFDCDGVLVDSEPLTNVVIRDNLAQHGLDLSIDQIIDLFVGGTIMGVMTTAREMGARLPDDWVDHIYSEVFDVLDEKVELIPGVVAVLDALDAAGIPYAVGSNGPHRKMDITLTRTSLMSRLRGRVFSREDVAAPKPAPDVYLKAAASVGILPSRCIVVEDSASGARAGKAAGMYTLGFVAETDPARMRPICDALFKSMDELIPLLQV